MSFAHTSLITLHSLQNYLGKEYMKYMDRTACLQRKNHTYENCLLPQYNWLCDF